MHNCHLCQSSCQQSYNSLYNHLNDDHHINVHDYYMTYISAVKTPADLKETKKDESFGVDFKENKEMFDALRNPDILPEQKTDDFESWVGCDSGDGG